ncbi:hypothetical protein CORC01_06352 [Colletotrichum orchidophilum]|uniref:Uncharacterized protein n=1 Tax=Colletotrichum orchidophilum TaxID=1209926 RepID=A0A1G4BAL7_9PEZI|nr:uncharacterized protein CORC01_06352 [Colletotrichum orchidophilum]OHE98356.1 hypothetical protein CORC01_06352 [Colletotrichum orchidophilum]
MILNQGMFAGSEGYVLKPDRCQRDKGAEVTLTSDVGEEIMGSNIKSKELDRVPVTVLAAQSLPLLNPHDDPTKFIPYVKGVLHTEPDVLTAMVRQDADRDQVQQISCSGQTSQSTGTSPDFGGDVIEFLNIEDVAPELAFLSFIIMSDVVGLDVMTAWACVHLDKLRLDHRFARLLDEDGMPSRGILLLKTEMEEAVAASSTQLDNGDIGIDRSRAVGTLRKSAVGWTFTAEREEILDLQPAPFRYALAAD